MSQQLGAPDFSRQRSSYGGQMSSGGDAMSGGSGSTYGKGSQRRGKNMSKANKDSSHGQQQPAVMNYPEPPIRTVENPYVAKKLSNKELGEMEVLLREVRNILNKLTPQNISKLTDDLLNLNISNEDQLKGTIDIIFEKVKLNIDNLKKSFLMNKKCLNNKIKYCYIFFV